MSALHSLSVEGIIDCPLLLYTLFLYFFSRCEFRWQFRVFCDFRIDIDHRHNGIWQTRNTTQKCR